MIITLTNDLLGTSVNLRLHNKQRWHYAVSDKLADKWTLSRRQVVRAREALLSGPNASGVCSVGICGEHGQQITKDGRRILLEYDNDNFNSVDLEIVP